MKALARAALVRVILPVCASCVIAVGSAMVSALVMTERLDGRVTHLEVQIERHEKALDRDFARHEQTVLEIAHRTDDQERRLSRLEALVSQTQELLSEIRSDVKILLRGGQQ